MYYTRHRYRNPMMSAWNGQYLAREAAIAMAQSHGAFPGFPGPKSVMIDVREPAEVAATGWLGHILAIPVAQLTTQVDTLLVATGGDRNVQIKVHPAGERSVRAVAILQRLGFRNATEAEPERVRGCETPNSRSCVVKPATPTHRNRGGYG